MPKDEREGRRAGVISWKNFILISAAYMVLVSVYFLFTGWPLALATSSMGMVMLTLVLDAERQRSWRIRAIQVLGFCAMLVGTVLVWTDIFLS